MNFDYQKDQSSLNRIFPEKNQLHCQTQFPTPDSTQWAPSQSHRAPEQRPHQERSSGPLRVPVLPRLLP